jgi:hypothetical protein
LNTMCGRMCSRNVLGIVQREEFRRISGKYDTVLDERRFNVCKSVHHRTIKINHQPDATVFQFYYPDVYLQFNMFWAFFRPSSGAQRLQ